MHTKQSNLVYPSSRRLTQPSQHQQPQNHVPVMVPVDGAQRVGNGDDDCARLQPLLAVIRCDRADGIRNRLSAALISTVSPIHITGNGCTIGTIFMLRGRRR